MIKHLLTFSVSLCMFTSVASAAEAAASAHFIGALREAITENDQQKLEALTFFEGASPQDKQRTSSMLRMLFMSGKDVEVISLEPLPSDFESVIIMRGQKIEPTAPSVGMVQITFKGAAQGQGNAASAYTIVGDKFFLVGMKSTDLGWKGPPDRNIGYSIVGQGASGVKVEGAWNASGVPLKKAFKETSLTFWGQYIEELKVTSDHGDCDVTVTITEDGKAIHTEPLKGKGVLLYKKKSE